MQDDDFGQNFMWYEWGFVSPGDVPCDEPRVTVDSDRPGASSRPALEWARPRLPSICGVSASDRESVRCRLSSSRPWTT